MGIEYLGLAASMVRLSFWKEYRTHFLMRSSNLRLMEKRKKSEGSLNYTKIKR